MALARAPLSRPPQVEVVAGSKEDFEVWEGWVHSRMRLLIKVRQPGALGRCWLATFCAPSEHTSRMRLAIKVRQPGAQGASRWSVCVVSLHLLSALPAWGLLMMRGAAHCVACVGRGGAEPA